MNDVSRTKILYISGYGRSGSTLLDIALGHHPQLLGSGEIMALTRYSWPNNEYCACGAALQSCPFWAEVMTRWTGGQASAVLDYRREQPHVESILGLRRLTRGLTPGWWTRRIAEPTAALFRTLSSRSGKPIIVDSSKLPGRGLALLSTPGLDVHVVHLVRDPRAVVWSMSKKIRRQVEAGVQKELLPKASLYIALRWLIVNLATERLVARVGRGRSLRIRYEDFVTNPAVALEQILGMMKLSAAGLPDGVHAPLHPQHQAAGSRHRMQKQLTIKNDGGWQEEMPVFKQWLVATCCAPLLRRYGYPWRSDRSAPLQEALAS